MASSTFHRTFSRTCVLIAMAMLGAAGILLAGSSSAFATTVTQSPAELNPLQEWTDSAAAPTPTVTVRVTYGDCGRNVFQIACSTYNPETKVGLITMDPSLRTDAAKRIYFHELGHIFASRHMYENDRVEAASILGFPAGTPWTDTSGSVQPSEWFAEAAARCYLDGNPILVAYNFQFDFQSPEVQGVCALMDRAALQRPVERVTFKVRVPSHRRMESLGGFEPGSIVATVRMGGRWIRSRAECFDTLRVRKNLITVGTCGRKVRVWSRSRRPAMLVVSGVPSDPERSTRFVSWSISKRHR